MKKILILIALLAAYSNIFAFLTQANWRWRNDDGSEVFATWKANQNTQITIPHDSTNEILRLRLEVYNNTGSSVGLLDTLQYATSTAGPWTNIDTAAGFNPFKIADTSAYLMQDDPTTAQLAGVALTFSPGKVMVDSMVLKNLNLADQQRTEFEWTIRTTPNMTPNTTYYFREWGSTANNLDIGMTYPSLNTTVVLPVKLTSFTVTRDNKKIKVQWVTASEQNSDRFEIQRSSDGRTWKTIATIKGKGTTVASNAYQVYDDNPLSGINYYVLKQYDVDGHSYLSDVKFVRMPDVNSIVTVYPNPAHSAINFSIVNKGASNVQAILTDINGNIVHQEIFKSVPANTVNTLNMAHQPAPGVYILKLKAEGLSESVRVVIE